MKKKYIIPDIVLISGDSEPFMAVSMGFSHEEVKPEDAEAKGYEFDDFYDDFSLTSYYDDEDSEDIY